MVCGQEGCPRQFSSFNSLHWHLLNRHADSIAEVEKTHNSESFHHANTATDVNAQTQIAESEPFFGMAIQFLVQA